MKAWDDDAEEALLLMGLAAPDADGFTYGAWTGFRSEADAREFANRWNAFPVLLAALKTAIMACEVYEGQSGILDEAKEHMIAAMKKAEGRA